MKFNLMFGSLALLGLATLMACNKESQTDLQDRSSSEDAVTFQNMIEDIDDQVDYVLDTRGLTNTNCPTVTISPDDNTYPRTILIDYGAEGCEGPFGRIRKGQIQVSLSDSILNTGAIRTVELFDFSIDDVQLEGIKTLTNTGENSEGQLTFSRTVDGGLLIFPNDQTISFESDHELVLTEGENTPELMDNVWSITGNSSGINRQDKAFSASIESPLIKPRYCRWITAGTRLVSVEDRTRSLDYGDGECNRQATVTTNNGNEWEILIRRWW